MAMFNSHVSVVGRIKNGRITYVTTKGGVSRPVTAPTPQREVLVGEVLDVRQPAVQPIPEPIMGCDWVPDERSYDAYDMLFGRG